MKTLPTIIICDCGEIVIGRTKVEAMRKESDHLMKEHPQRYESMLEFFTPSKIQQWMQLHMAQLVR